MRRAKGLPLGSNGHGNCTALLPCQFCVMRSARRRSSRGENLPCRLQKSLLPRLCRCVHPISPRNRQRNPGAAYWLCPFRALFVPVRVVVTLRCSRCIEAMTPSRACKLAADHGWNTLLMSKAVIIPCWCRMRICKSYASLQILQRCLSRYEVSSRRPKVLSDVGVRYWGPGLQLITIPRSEDEFALFEPSEIFTSNSGTCLVS